MAICCEFLQSAQENNYKFLKWVLYWESIFFESDNIMCMFKDARDMEIRVYSAQNIKYLNIKKIWHYK